jgi:hypothetical protein
MENTNNQSFPEQEHPSKLHGTHNDPGKEKYIRDSGKIEDMPEDTETPKMKATEKRESTHLTDRSGEEKKEDYINTDERKNDLERRGL